MTAHGSTPSSGGASPPTSAPTTDSLYAALVDAVSSGAVLMVGAGSSRKAGYPAWGGLLNRLESEAQRIDAGKAAEVAGVYPHEVDGLVRASVYRKILGESAYFAILREAFGPRTPPHTREHESLVRLPFRHVLSTNYDAVLPSAHRQCFGIDPVVFDADEWEKLSQFRQSHATSRSSPVYVHLHGSVGRPAGIVLCKEDYDSRYYQETRYQQFLREFLIGQRLVFVGFSLDDQDFKHVLRQAEACLQPSGPRHFVILPARASPEASRVERINLRTMYGVEPVYFDNASGDFSGLWALIDRLSADVAEHAKGGAVVSVDRLPELIERLLPDHPVQRAEATRRLATLLPMFLVAAGAQGTDLSAVTTVDQEIDSIFRLVDEGAPQDAISQYEQLREREELRLTPKQRYRIEANIGNALYSMRKLAEASNHYLRAVGHYRESHDALAIEVLAHVLAGNWAEAARLAEELRVRAPDLERGWSLWVRAQPDDADLRMVEAAVPAALRSKGEVALSLAELAARQQDAAAQVRHARAAVASSPDWPDAWVMLGAALLVLGRGAVSFDAERGIIPDDPAPVLEAESVLSKAVEVIGERDPAGRLAGALFNRSAARRLLGRLDDASSDLDQAFRLDSTEPIIALGFAMHAKSPMEIEAALPALDGLAGDDEHRDQALFARAYLLLSRESDGDELSALSLLDVLCARLDRVEPTTLRTDIARMALRARTALGQSKTGPAFIDGLPSDAIPELQRTLLKARALLQAGEQEPAKLLVAEAIAGMPESATWFDRRDAAVLALNVGLPAESLALWRKVVPENYSGPDSLYVVHAAYFAHEWRTALDICAAVRAADRANAGHLQIEAEILAQSREVDRALELLREWVKQHPDDKRMTLRLSSLSLRLGDGTDAVFDAPRLPTALEAADPREGAMLVFVLRRGPNPAEALEAAYALYRRFPDNIGANWCLIACVLDPSATPLEIYRPTAVAEDAAALVGREGDQPRWIYVEPSPIPAHSRGEFPPTHALVRAMWGLAAGATFEYLDHTYRVLEVESRVLRRVHEIMEHFEENFPGQAMLRSYRVPKSAPPDASLKDKLGEVHAALERQDKGRQNLESAYRENRLPIASYSRLFGRPVFDIVRYLASDRSLGVRADDGDPRRWPGAMAAARSPELVVDATVLASALVLGLLDDLARLGPRLVVPRSVLDELRRASLEAGQASKGGGVMGLHQGQFFFRERSPEEVAQEVRLLEGVIKFVQTHCEVVGGEATLDMPAALREALQEMLDATSVDAVALAVRRNCPLWTDDLGLQRLVIECGIQMSTVWTQAVLKSAHEAGTFSQSDLGRAQAAMVDRRYIFTRLTAEDILGILDAVDWRVGHGPGHALCSVVAESALLNPNNLAVVATAMKTAWSRGRLERAKAFVLGVVEANPLNSKRLAARIYRLPKFRRNVRLRTDTMSEASGSTHPRHHVRILPVMFDPLGDRAGKAVKRYLRSWRSRDGEFRPRTNR